MRDMRGYDLLLLSAVVLAAVFARVPPLPQWPEYHDFADRRAWLGVPNFSDFACNTLFTLVGPSGVHRLLLAKRRPLFHDRRDGCCAC
jgi:hypothetical protein